MHYRRSLSPVRVLVLSFVVLIFSGALCLLLPGMVTGEPLAFSDALFTATSAVCVTGLTVCDTGSRFTLGGQVVILVLIQVGGLGLLTFSNMLLLLHRGRLNLAQRSLLEHSHGLLPGISAAELLKSIVQYTLLFEVLGSLLLALRFHISYGFSVPQALWQGVFHAVSAFCNAGFSLFNNSLVNYNSDAVMQLIIMGLIITGGLGFVVFADLKQNLLNRWYKRRYRLTLHSKIVLFSSLMLIVGGAMIFWLLELTGPAMPKSWLLHTLDSLFLSVTARTAGFNTLDMAQLTNSSLLILLCLMMIGGSPGSTAGGIKTTCLATLVAMFRSRISNRPRCELFQRSLPQDSVAKALATVASFLGVALLAMLALQITELYGVAHSAHRGQFLEYMFEVVSALATVGLSTGVTSTLTDGGRLVIIVCMFCGRLGPVLIANSLIGRVPRQEYSYPEEEIISG